MEIQKIQALMILPLNTGNFLMQKYFGIRFYIDWLCGKFPPDGTDEIIYLK
jgi:hypothetical protein